MKTMCSFLLVVLFLLSGTFAAIPGPGSGGKSKKLISRYKDKVVVDGNSSEWQPADFELNEMTQAAYAIANDTANLYVCLKLAGEMQQMKALHGGLELWIDAKDKKNRVTGIRFPLPNAVSPVEKSGLRNSENADRNKMKLMYLLQLKDMQLAGFREGMNGFQSNKANPAGIQVILNWDSNNVMVYEAKIPLRDLKEDLTKTGPFTIGFVMKGLPKQEGKHADNRNDDPGEMGGMAGGGGYPRQGGRPGGGDQPGSGGMQKMFLDVMFWQEVKIAAGI